MIIIVLLFIVILAGVIAVAVSPRFRLSMCPNWKSLHKTFSVQMAALSAFLVLLMPMAENLQSILPQLDSVQVIASITSTQAYKTAVGLLTLFVIVARGLVLPPKP